MSAVHPRQPAYPAVGQRDATPHRPGSGSLRVRLLIAMLLAIFLVWGAWFGCQALEMSRQQTGWWDTALKNIAHQMILSLPADTMPSSQQRTLELPGAIEFDGVKLGYQVWAGQPPQIVLRSPGTPAAPFKPDFHDGFAQSHAGGEWRVYAASDADGRVFVQVAKPTAQLQRELATWASASLLTAFGLFAALAGAIWLVIGWSLRPVVAIQQTIASRGSLQLEPLPLDGLPQEWRPLVESFNRLLDRVAGSVQSERRFVADAAHELRTPLAALLGQAEVAQRSLRRGDVTGAAQSLQTLEEVAQRSTRLSEQLLDLARLDAGADLRVRRSVELHELVSLVVHDLQGALRSKDQKIMLTVQPAIVHADLDELGILVRNLVDNAIRYTPRGGRIDVSCNAGTSGERKVATLRVADDGIGVPLDERPRVLDRFYRASNAGAGGPGSGLGLALVARIAAGHGAALRLADGLDGRGLAVIVEFPVSLRPAT